MSDHWGTHVPPHPPPLLLPVYSPSRIYIRMYMLVLHTYYSRSTGQQVCGPFGAGGGAGQGGEGACSLPMHAAPLPYFHPPVNATIMYVNTVRVLCRFLRKHFPALLERCGGRDRILQILVPFCGKTLDLLWYDPLWWADNTYIWGLVKTSWYAQCLI